MQQRDLCPNRKDYYTQLNNEKDPTIACQVTAAIQCLDIIGEINKITGPHKQPEDNLRLLCEQPNVLEFGNKYYGSKSDWLNAVEHPSEWSGILVHVINKTLGYDCAEFVPVLTNSKIAEHILGHEPVQCSMQFRPKYPGHYISVVGITPENNFIVNDPYRDLFHDKDDGYHIEVTPDEWKTHYKGYGIVYNRRSI